ncbi:MAG: hypothetical protein P8178_09930 [Candidatus Thiodiazotropha sp.]
MSVPLPVIGNNGLSGGIVGVSPDWPLLPDQYQARIDTTIADARTSDALNHPAPTSDE